MYRSGITYSEAVREFKKRFILTVLQDSKGNQCKAAAPVGHAPQYSEPHHRRAEARSQRSCATGTRRPPRSAHALPWTEKAAR